MTAIQIAALALVAVTGTVVALIGDALRQAIVLALYGLSLTLLFFSVQAPDVALSEIVVSGIGLPVIILAALRKIHEQERSDREEHEQ